MGQTRDDAAGEAFDKIARVMGYPYPGGPQIDKLAALGNADAVVFPKALHERNNFEFIIMNFKKFAGHQFVIIIICNRKNGLTDHFFQRELRK